VATPVEWRKSLRSTFTADNLVDWWWVVTAPSAVRLREEEEAEKASVDKAKKNRE
jgi:hypothetical protein